MSCTWLLSSTRGVDLRAISAHWDVVADSSCLSSSPHSSERSLPVLLEQALWWVQLVAVAAPGRVVEKDTTPVRW